MAVQVNIADAKAKLSSLLDRALAGEEVVIAGRQTVGAPRADREAAAAQKRAWREWKISSDALLEPMEPEDLDAAEGKYTDEFGITLPRSPDS